MFMTGSLPIVEARYWPSSHAGSMLKRISGLTAGGRRLAGREAAREASGAHEASREAEDNDKDAVAGHHQNST
jgi:hypothetical protein